MDGVLEQCMETKEQASGIVDSSPTLQKAAQVSNLTAILKLLEGDA